jgi:hypothetical protein
MAIALRNAGLWETSPTNIEELDETNQLNPHYLGWARHSYNDNLKVNEQRLVSRLSSTVPRN